MSQGHLRWRHRCEDLRKRKKQPNPNESVRSSEASAVSRVRREQIDEAETESSVESESSEEPTRGPAFDRRLDHDRAAVQRYEVPAHARSGYLTPVHEALRKWELERRMGLRR